MPKKNLIEKINFSESTIRRCYEVIFYTAIKRTLIKNININRKEIFVHFAFFSNTTPDKLEYLYKRLCLPLSTPNNREKAIAFTYFKIPRKDIKKLFGTHNMTISKYLRKFGETGFELRPRLPKEDDEIIKIFYNEFCDTLKLFREV